MCLGVEFLASDVLLHSKSEQKEITNGFFTLIIFKNQLKTGASIKKYTFTISVRRVRIVIRYFLFEKTDF